MADSAAIYEPSSGGAFRQSEILCGVNQLKRALSEPTTPIRGDIVNHPFAIIVSQDCDLDLDFRARNGLLGPGNKPVGEEKTIPNILLCEVFTAKDLRASGRNSKEINSTIWDRINTNSESRYHFFQEAPPEADALKAGLPELAVDFKRYFSIPSGDLYLQLKQSLDPEKYPAIQRRLHLKSPYLEHFSTRFCSYLSRVALPEPHFSAPGG